MREQGEGGSGGPFCRSAGAWPFFAVLLPPFLFFFFRGPPLMRLFLLLPHLHREPDVPPRDADLEAEAAGYQ